jgi:hypothetical protein
MAWIVDDELWALAEPLTGLRPDRIDSVRGMLEQAIGDRNCIAKALHRGDFLAQARDTLIICGLERYRSEAGFRGLSRGSVRCRSLSGMPADRMVVLFGYLVLRQVRVFARSR